MNWRAIITTVSHPDRMAVVALLAALIQLTYAQQGTFDWDAVADTFPGVEFAAESVETPRVMDVFCVRVDARNPQIRFHATPRSADWIENSTETLRQTTRDFSRESRSRGMNMVVAINADAFEPWPAPWNERTPTDLRGLAVSEGVVVSPATTEPSFVIDEHARPAIVSVPPNPDDLETAVSGFAIVLENGAAIEGKPETHPRTGIGLSRDSRYVLFMVIDGRRHASQGATTREVGEWLLHFGAFTGLNMDGGGSATLARWDESAPGDGVALVNHPVGDGTNWLKFPPEKEAESYKPAERANGNNIGVYLAVPSK